MMRPQTYLDLGELLWLDLGQVTLYGYENGNSEEKINSIMRGIELGDDFPPVFVRRVSENEYIIDSGFDPFDDKNCGGHHRAIAYHRKRKSLKCLLVGNHVWYDLNKIRIEDLTVTNWGEDHFRAVQQLDPRFR
ncbi:hypothetical protein HZA97_05295 [Candidatus Woesearchaeota archaeon]|nr:hypothetical protein [Candidatus Woesearchaeota archaeon]